MFNALSVLFVDDDPVVGKLVIDFLQSENIDAYNALTISDALKMMRKIKPAVILLDWHLSDGDGAHFIERLSHQGEKWKNIPIIWVTAKALPGDKEACLEAGGIDYISKPFLLETLLDKIYTYAPS